MITESLNGRIGMGKDKRTKKEFGICNTGFGRVCNLEYSFNTCVVSSVSIILNSISFDDCDNTSMERKSSA